MAVAVVAEAAEVVAVVAVGDAPVAVEVAAAVAEAVADAPAAATNHSYLETEKDGANCSPRPLLLWDTTPRSTQPNLGQPRPE